MRRQLLLDSPLWYSCMLCTDSIDCYGWGYWMKLSEVGTQKYAGLDFRNCNWIYCFLEVLRLLHLNFFVLQEIRNMSCMDFFSNFLNVLIYLKAYSIYRQQLLLFFVDFKKSPWNHGRGCVKICVVVSEFRIILQLRIPIEIKL